MSKLEYEIRWLDNATKRDQPEPEYVAGLMKRSGSIFTMSAADIRAFCAMANRVPKVILVDKKIVGYLIYTIINNKYTLIEQIGIMREYRRQGLGTALVEHMKEHMRALRLDYAFVHADSRELDLQLFLRACGFFCERTVIPPDHDAEYYFFKMCVRRNQEHESGAQSAPKNKVPD